MNTHHHDHHCAQIDTEFTAATDDWPFSATAKLDDFIAWADTSDDLREATIEQLWAPTVHFVTALSTLDRENWTDDLVDGLSNEGSVILTLLIDALEIFGADCVDNALNDAAVLFRHVDDPDHAILTGIANLALILRISTGVWPAHR